MLTSWKLPLTFDAERLRQDAAAFQPEEWTPHFNIHNYQGDWSVVALRAAKGAVVAIYPDPFAKDGYAETPQMSRCSYVPEVLSALLCETTSARFLKLGAGAFIRRHRDYKLGLEDGEVRLHIPVFTNPQVEFLLDDKRVEMQAGETWYLNVNFYHSVNNQSSQDRIHLVIDCVVNDWLRALFPADA
jgi:aspartyl/asparaginyl beta-hydroxylase (cupin superfamily)